jgi:(p)ppGpp synthase/HD superfamily hydrolase
MTTLGSKIFRTTPLALFPLLTSLGFGAGVLLVGLGLKALKPEHVEKIPELINENANEKDDLFSKMQKNMSGKINKDNMERLLDSN